MPSIFNLRKISVIESSGLLLLSKILFGGFNKEHFKKNYLSKKDEDIRFANFKKEKNLTSEQKSLLKKQFYSKWCKKDEIEV